MFDGLDTDWAGPLKTEQVGRRLVIKGHPAAYGPDTLSQARPSPTRFCFIEMNGMSMMCLKEFEKEHITENKIEAKIHGIS